MPDSRTASASLAAVTDLTAVGALVGRLPGLSIADERRLGRRLEGLRKIRQPERRQSTLEQIAADVERAEARLAERRAAVPDISYPPQLPVSAARQQIADAIASSQVVVVAGETGSGKTTQLPKICLELGRGVRGRIGHTQPRRIAARTVAERVAQELETPLGAAVGYKVRFTDTVSDSTLVKVMTDGILLAEIGRDRLLTEYDTLIIDEAHERSLNIDFLLGYLKQLLPRRPDLKVVITSATIDTARFSRHFDDCPVVEVSGRSYPVEVRYRPLTRLAALDDEDDGDGETWQSGVRGSGSATAGTPTRDDTDPQDERDQITGIVDAVRELCAEGPGDILVFLSGEREIRDAADALQAAAAEGLDRGRDLEILPLFARLSAAEQHRVFASHQGRRIVLATNVAETSLTVPGIRYVVDPGTARISRYSTRLKVQRLPIEPISQASANQRAGRCGRVAEGICIRLYSEEDVLSRPEFTEPEILRTNLASVILQMTSLGLGDIAAFPFVEAPDRRNIRDGLELLHELGALPGKGEPTGRHRLTPVGEQLAAMPVDPRLARMVVEADRLGCLREVIVITSALSIQDPRERPVELRAAADQKHARFRDKESDFVTYVALWDWLQEQQRELSGNQFRKLCRSDYLNYLRIREWQDLYSQLRQVCRQLGFSLNDSPAGPAQLHQALLAGLLSHVGMKDAERPDYLGARGARFAVFPGSVLHKKTPRYVMAAELVETSRLWGRVCARIEPEWAERLGAHLVKRSYSEPHWEKKRGSAVAVERVTLYGVPLVVGRKVDYARVDPELSRELFLRHALVEGDWDSHHTFLTRNRELLEEVAELEDRARRRDLVVDEDALYDFYDSRVPRDVVSARHFDAWWRKERRRSPELLTFDRDLLLSGADLPTEEQYPSVWDQGPLTFRLDYAFEPGAPQDGVTVDVPVDVLNQVEPGTFLWHIPGLRHELVTELIRALPKQLRRNFVPAPDVARRALEQLPEGEGDLLAQLSAVLRRMTGVSVPVDAWALDTLPPHLRVRFRVVDGQGHVLDEDRDFAALRSRLAADVARTVAAAGAQLERTGATAWVFGEIPRSIEVSRAGRPVTGYPALVDEGRSVGLRVLPTPGEQADAIWRGERRLLLLTLPSPTKPVINALSNAAKLTLAANPHGGVAPLLDDVVTASLDALMERHAAPVWTEEGFDALREAVRPELVETVLDALEQVRQALALWQQLRADLPRVTAAVARPAVEDISAQLDAHVFPAFVTATGITHLPDLVRWLTAAARRLQRLQEDPRRDSAAMPAVVSAHALYDDVVESLPPAQRGSREVRELRWMLEELRVSLFAPGMRTAYPISEKRIAKA
ncbi:MAG: ATP-dependent RNA helicase HrpA, partial [Actinomycetes bacterium]